MRKTTTLVIVLLAALLLLAGCGGNDDNNGGDDADAPEAVGDPVQGEALYTQNVIGNGAPGCITCHSMEEDVVLVGPSHANLAQRAGEYVEELNAEEYLRQSIVEPDAHIVEGFPPGVMYQNYEEALTDEQIDDLVAFLLTLE